MIKCECDLCNCANQITIGAGYLGHLCGECVDKLWEIEKESA